MNNQDSFQAPATAGPSLHKASAHAIPAANVPLSDFPAPDAPASGTPAYDVALPVAAPDATIDAPAQVPPTSEAQSLLAARASGANWFFWIVGLSVLNTLLTLAGTDWGFPLGAAASQIADALAYEGGSTVGRIFALGFDVLVIGLYAMCGVQAMRGQSWAFVLGLAVFALDTLLTLLIQQWIGVALHMWALFSIFTGLMANNNLKKMERAGVATDAAPTPWSA